jgi:hypothetical protein
VGAGASVHNIQAGGVNAQQHAEVVVNTAPAVAEWARTARAWLDEETGLDGTDRGVIIARLEDVEEVLHTPDPNPARLRQVMTKGRDAVAAVSVATLGSALAPGVIETAHHLVNLL